MRRATCTEPCFVHFYNKSQISHIYPPSLKSIVYREKEQIIIKCLDDSFSGKYFCLHFYWLVDYTVIKEDC